MEKSSEEQMKPPENVTGNAAPASIDGDGASSLSCAVTAAVTTKAKRTKASKALQILTCAISIQYGRAIDPPRDLERRTWCELFSSRGLRRPDKDEGEPSKNRKRNSGNEAETSMEFEEIELEIEVESDEDGRTEEDDLR
ncbi:hypothetical protein LWI28_015194 [Acer negundo]|uniref:Uncharacterized protein n=1 Tax=Acer negundo TaxID=4023 RepID=A0AAD5JL03_ACENE|nr:hypothetical protein LWI28_015194 [Acer negundo]